MAPSVKSEGPEKSGRIKRCVFIVFDHKILLKKRRMVTKQKTKTAQSGEKENVTGNVKIDFITKYERRYYDGQIELFFQRI